MTQRIEYRGSCTAVRNRRPMHAVRRAGMGLRGIGWIALCWALLFHPPAYGTDPVVTLATLNWQPYVGEDLPACGFTTEIVRQAFQRAGCRIEVTFMPWMRALAEVEAGRYDGLYPAYFSDVRARIFALSDSIANSSLVLCKRSDRGIRYQVLEDLKPYRIGVVRGYVNTPEFDAADFLDKKIVNSDKQNLLKVLTGRIELAVIDIYTAQMMMETEIPQARGRLDFLTPALETKTLHVGLSRERPGFQERLTAFNQALRELKEEGVIEKIYAEHGFHAFRNRKPGANQPDAPSAP